MDEIPIPNTDIIIKVPKSLLSKLSEKVPKRLLKWLPSISIPILGKLMGKKVNDHSDLDIDKIKDELELCDGTEFELNQEDLDSFYNDSFYNSSTVLNYFKFLTFLINLLK